MRITDTSNRAAEQALTTKSGQAHGTRKGPPPPPPPSAVSTAGAVKVSVSAEAKALAAAASASASSASSDVDTAKVDRLKAAISDGSYKIDAGAIADKIVNEGE